MCLVHAPGVSPHKIASGADTLVINQAALDDVGLLDTQVPVKREFRTRLGLEQRRETLAVRFLEQDLDPDPRLAMKIWIWTRIQIGSGFRSGSGSQQGIFMFFPREAMLPAVPCRFLTLIRIWIQIRTRISQGPQRGTWNVESTNTPFPLARVCFVFLYCPCLDQGVQNPNQGKITSDLMLC